MKNVARRSLAWAPWLALLVSGCTSPGVHVEGHGFALAVSGEHVACSPGAVQQQGALRARVTSLRRPAEEVRDLDLPAGEVHALAFGEDGLRVLFTSAKGLELRRFDPTTARSLGSPVALERPTSLVPPRAASSDGVRWVLGWADVVRCVEVEGDRARTVWEVGLPRGQLVGQLTVSADGALVAVALAHPRGGRASPAAVQLLDGATGRPGAALSAPGPFGDVGCLAFAPDGRTLATGDDGPEVRLWDVAGASLRASFDPQAGGRVTSLAWSSEGLALGSDARAVALFAVAGDGAAREVWRDPAPDGVAVKGTTTVAASPDGRLVVRAAPAIGADHRQLRLLDAASGRDR